MMAAIDADRPIIQPHPNTPQHDALESDADIVILGGANGGGKTWGLAFAPLGPALDDGEFRGIIFRRTRPQIKQGGGLLDETKDLYRPQGGDLNRNELTWSFPPGSKLQLRGLQYADDVEDYDGAQLTFLGYDQLEQFGARQFFYMLGRLRSPKCSWKPFCFATCNPSEPGHWLNDFVQPWLDEDGEYPDRDKAGQRWHFFREGDTGWTWVDADATKTVELPNGEEIEVGPSSVEFYPSTVFDNPSILENNPEYVARLQSQDRVDRQQKLHGSWKVKRGEGPFTDHAMQVVDAAPDDLTQSYRYWDLADTEPSPSNKNPCHTAGVRGGVVRRMWTVCTNVARPNADEDDGQDCEFWGAGKVEGACPKCGEDTLFAEQKEVLVIEDARWFQRSGDQKTRRMVQVAQGDGTGVSIRIEQEPGATGKESIRKYKRETFGRSFDVDGDYPTGAKYSRVTGLVDLANQGRIWLVRGQWNAGFKSALERLDPMDVPDATAGLHKVASEGGRGRYLGSY